jgi:glycosyltransferase involved in cell wall biosynthesis
VTFISQHLGRPLGFGTSSYSYNLYNALRKRIDLRPLTPPMVIDPPISGLDIFVLIPLKILIERPESDIYHLTLPYHGFLIPLIRLLNPKARIITTVYDLIPQLIGRNPAYRGIHSPFRGWRRLTTPFTSIFRMKGLEMALRDSDLLISISSQTKSDLISLYGVDERKICVSQLGVDEKFQSKKAKNGIFTVGYLGRFEIYKDIPFLIRGYSILEKKNPAKSRLVLYGSGVSMEECKNLVIELGLKTVEFRGFAPEADLVDIYNSFDAFVFPSDVEGFGLPIIEAQKCGVPVIVKESTHVPSEVTAFCLKARDEKHLAAILEKLMKDGFVFSEEHKRHLSRFSWDDCADSTIKAYEEALK